MDRVIGALVFSDEVEEPWISEWLVRFYFQPDQVNTQGFEISEWNVLSLISPESANG